MISLLIINNQLWSVSVLLFSFFFKLNLFIYFWLHWVFVVLRGLLTVVASLVVEHGL